jgi:hypothetical protein
VLRYASEWATPEDARRFFELYRGIAATRRGSDYRVVTADEDKTVARTPAGRVEIALVGLTVTSLEGDPDDSEAALR